MSATTSSPSDSSNKKDKDDIPDFPKPLELPPLLHQAVMRNELNAVKALMECCDDDINAIVDQHGRTALHYAAFYGNRIPIMDVLVKAGCDINGGDSFGKTPLYYAMKKFPWFNRT